MQTLKQRPHKPHSKVEVREAEASSVALQHLLGKDEQPLKQITLHVSIEQPDGKEQEEAERHRGLDEMVAEAQKLGMY